MNLRVREAVIALLKTQVQIQYTERLIKLHKPILCIHTAIVVCERKHLGLAYYR
jgi:hypothetical protein